ncbi:MAG: cytochrome c-type biogenesis protein CcmH [Proteobacteria bacterium]|nr:cytochrome c-type biogenesis protein CcmH [Pseudomonadota bacterium]
MLMNRLTALIVVGLLATGLSLGEAGAVNPDEVLEDPVLEGRARELSKILRCLVCQNQSIDDSNAGLAGDLRIIVRERLVAGDSDDEVIQYIVDRYGDYVLLEPQVKGANYVLWYGPPILLVLGGAGLLIAARRRRKIVPAEGLSEDEKRRLAQLLDDKGADS